MDESGFGDAVQTSAPRMLARRRFVPSMRQRIDLAGIYIDAVRGLPDTIDGTPPLPVPEICPTTLDELLATD
jgi:hypothetical protein